MVCRMAGTKVKVKVTQGKSTVSPPCYVLHFVTAIIYYAIQRIFIKYAIATTSPESKFPNEYSDVIFIQIYQHLKKLLQKYKGVRIL